MDNKIIFDRFVLTTREDIQNINKTMDRFKLMFSKDLNVNRYASLAIVLHQLKLIDIYFQHNQEYNTLFQSNNTSILDKIRKHLGEITNLLKQYFVISISTDFSKNEVCLENLQQFNSQRILNLLSHLESSCYKLRDTYGLTSKYLPTVAQIYGDIGGFMLNNIDIHGYIINVRDLRHSDYLNMKKILTLVENILDKSSSLFMDAFHLNNNVEQVVKSLNILDILLRFYRLSNSDHEKLSELERKKNSWERFLSN